MAIKFMLRFAVIFVFFGSSCAVCAEKAYIVAAMCGKRDGALSTVVIFKRSNNLGFARAGALEECLGAVGKQAKLGRNCCEPEVFMAESGTNSKCVSVAVGFEGLGSTYAGSTEREAADKAMVLCEHLHKSFHHPAGLCRPITRCL